MCIRDRVAAAVLNLFLIASLNMPLSGHSLPSKYQILCNISILNWVVGTWSDSRWWNVGLLKTWLLTFMSVFWCWFSIYMMHKFDWRPNYGQKSKLKMAAVRHHGFLKIKFDFWPMGLFRLLIFHLGTKFGAKMLMDAQIMSKNRTSRWRLSAILDFRKPHFWPVNSYIHIGPPTKSLRWDTSASQNFMI